MTFSSVTTRTETDWRAWVGRNLAVTNGGIELTSQRTLDREAIAEGVVDVAVHDGDVYTTHRSGAVYRHAPEREIEQCVWRASTHEATPGAVCVLGDRIYLADRESGDLFVVASRLQRLVGRIETEIASVVALASGSGEIYVLDGERDDIGVVQPDGGVEPVVTDCCEPVDLTVDDTGGPVVLEQTDDGPRIRAFTATGGERTDRFPITAFEAVTPTRLGSTTGDTLVVAGRTPDGQHALFECAPEGSSVTERYEFDTACRRLVTSDDETRYAVVGDECLGLTDTRTYRTQDGQHQAQAVRQFDAGVTDITWHRLTLDFDRPTASTQLRVRYSASDEATLLDDGLGSLGGIDDRTASRLDAAGIETVWDLLNHDPETVLDAVNTESIQTVRDWQDQARDAVETAAQSWQTVETPNTTETLLSDADGRFLRVNIELTGTATASPRVTALRAYCPRTTYLRYLPEVYADDEFGFLDRFLSVFETVFTEIDGEIDDLTKWVDPQAVPSESLPWLADWLAVDLDEGWPETAQRELVARAPDLYRKRGTKQGLRDLLSLYLRHVEPPDTQLDSLVVPDPTGEQPSPQTESGTGSETGVVDGGRAQHGLVILEPGDFDGIDSEPARQAYTGDTTSGPSVRVLAGPFASADHRTTVEDLVASETPVHVESTVSELDTEFALDGSSFLAVNTRLTTRTFEVGGATLGRDAVLEPRQNEQQS